MVSSRKDKRSGCKDSLKDETFKKRNPSRGERSREGTPLEGMTLTVTFSQVHADNLANVDEGTNGASDPYVVFMENGVRLCKTEVLKDSMGHSGTAKPVWGGEYEGRLS